MVVGVKSTIQTLSELGVASCGLLAWQCLLLPKLAVRPSSEFTRGRAYGIVEGQKSPLGREPEDRIDDCCGLHLATREVPDGVRACRLNTS
jgi:hypothetical protein